ncbi:hypothetical protein CSW98_07605 [Vibrio sp. HA2012]|uniref:DUF2850 domain-containing protein n=1 Tax=Vibrio sp. HA2012 TaxID=1971595 RepID=UPI000C2BD083|nr:DUF2850 domain-containing protein [Vibrio sp. HA2012]PJC86851.1 hypothetical protein CSW98_07605 [Vibrio sp. HA2012]
MAQELLRKHNNQKQRNAEMQRRREVLRKQALQVKAAAEAEARKAEEKRSVPWGKYIWLVMMLLTSAAIGRVAYINYREYVDPQRIYGEWIETASPGYDTEVFSISEQGVMTDSRYITSEVEFNGDIVAFRFGNIRYEYQLFGEFDERLKRVAGEGHPAVFVKKGYEHTMPKADAVGPARRVSLAEHFQSK